MSIVTSLRIDLGRITISRRSDHHHYKKRTSYIISMKDDSKTVSSEQKNNEEILRSEKQKLGGQYELSELRFDRLQPSDDDIDCKHKRVFGRFIAREALLDEEFWTAAWLRAESHWEDKSDMRNVDFFKRKFAEQEFNAIKKRCTGTYLAGSEKSTCIIVVKKENTKRTVLSSIVGTLDINIRHLQCGEAFPGEKIKTPIFSNIFGRKNQPLYGYIANLSVAKYARRKGIASNMIVLAMEAAKSYAVNEVYVHVYKDNIAARKLYEKLGFEMVERAMPQSEEEQKYLLCLKT